MYIFNVTACLYSVYNEKTKKVLCGKVILNLQQLLRGYDPKYEYLFMENSFMFSFLQHKQNEFGTLRLTASPYSFIYFICRIFISIAVKMSIWKKIISSDNVQYIQICLAQTVRSKTLKCWLRSVWNQIFNIEINIATNIAYDKTAAVMEFQKKKTLDQNTLYSRVFK